MQQFGRALGGPARQIQIPDGTYAETRDADGEVVDHVQWQYSAKKAPTIGASPLGRPFTQDGWRIAGAVWDDERDGVSLEGWEKG